MAKKPSQETSPTMQFLTTLLGIEFYHFKKIHYTFENGTGNFPSNTLTTFITKVDDFYLFISLLVAPLSISAFIYGQGYPSMSFTYQTRAK